MEGWKRRFFDHAQDKTICIELRLGMWDRSRRRTMHISGAGQYFEESPAIKGEGKQQSRKLRSGTKGRSVHNGAALTEGWYQTRLRAGVLSV